MPAKPSAALPNQLKANLRAGREAVRQSPSQNLTNN
jgi:hypothetical protein